MTSNGMIDKAFDVVLTPIFSVLKFLVNLIFINDFVTMIVFLVLVNIIAIILMKRDKTYAETEQRRIRESTLLLVALVGGSMGMYYAMYKYKHKTLHTKFVVGVPAIICLQSAFISCLFVTKLLVV